MCGICAIFSYDSSAPQFELDELRRIRDHMAMRGPDGKGEWVGEEGRVALGHRRLAIIDLSETGAQPMATDDGQVVVTFNGEIYNYKELRIELEAKGFVFRSQSDTEVLLHLYQDRGQEMVRDLRGMYAFAIWDKRRKGLFLVRDPFGIKPLYYADDGKTIRVASQVKALLAGGQVDTSPEPAGHVGFFLWGNVPEPYTLYRGIHALPAGCSLWIDRKGPSSIRTFLIIMQKPTACSDDSSTVKANKPNPLLREVLFDSVRHHLLADVPVGVFLSAGLDSATLTALASEVCGGKLRTLTLGFQEYRGTPSDETILAAEVARKYKTQHETIWIEKRDFESEFGRLLDVMDQPTVDGVNSYFVSRAAAATGLKVAISGIGGDELFGGYPSFRQIPAMVRRFGWARRVPFLGRAVRLVAAPVLKRFTSPKYAGLLEHAGTYSGAYMLRRGLFMPWELPEVLDPEMAEEGWRRLEALVALNFTERDIPEPFAKVRELEINWYMRNQLLRDTDWASMAHSLEVRVPLVDIRLFRAVSNSTDSIRPCKLQLAEAPSDPLPPAILARKKSGFSVPVRQWLLNETNYRAERGLRGWARTIYKCHSRSVRLRISESQSHRKTLFPG